MMRALLSAALLVLAFLLPVDAGSYGKELMLSATDHYGGYADKTSPIHIMPEDAENLYCEIDLTAISGTNPGFQFYVVACEAHHVPDGTCAGHAEIEAWYKGTQHAAPANERILITREATATEADPGVSTDIADKEMNGHLPRLWAAFGSQWGDGADVTVSYTVHCIWW